MLVKVCGIRTKGNLEYLEQSNVDMIGFIFYPKSKRFFDEGDLSAEDLEGITKNKVGVFVNASLTFVKEKVATYGLDFVQLHGSESPNYCESLRLTGVKVIKAFGVESSLPKELSSYVDSVDLLLFDTKSVNHGGTGRQFDWEVLENYDLNVPFLLSGGIGPDDTETIKSLKMKSMAGIDINSRFEIAPGLKDENKLEEFLDKVK